MVAITSGKVPWGSIGSTVSFLKPMPRISSDTTSANATAGQSDSPSTPMPVSTKKAGNMTNSPWAKLMVCDACHSSVKPTAARA